MNVKVNGIAKQEPARAEDGRQPAIDLLLVIPTLTPGGAERVFLNLARNLDRSRYNVALAVFDLTGAAYLDDLPEDVTLIDLHAERVRRGLWKAIRLIRSMNPSVVMSTLNHLNVALGLTKPFWPAHVRYAVRPTLSASTDFAAHAHSPVSRLSYRLGFGNADLLIFQSQAMADDFERVLQTEKRRSVVICNPLDIDRIRHLAREDVGIRQTDSDVFKIVAAGRLEQQKGFDLLIEAVSRLSNRRLSLTILGDGPLRPSLEEQIRALKIGDRVFLPGHVANPYAYFARSDVFVLSSHFEGFANVVLEALACGLPVLTTPLPGIAEVVGAIPHCEVIAAANVESMTAGLIRAMSRGSPRVPDDAVGSYDSSKIVRAYENALHGLVSGRLDHESVVTT